MAFMKFGISREMAKSIFGEDWIQKSKKGEQKSDHKYIWRTPKDNGKGYDYIYEDDQVKNPFEMLLKFFKIGKSTVSKMYKDNNIEADYKATENQFASHVLEYETNKSKWDKLFTKLTNNKATKNPKTMAQAKDIEKKEAEKKGKEAVKKLEEKKFVPNKTLMRKIWAIRNPEKAKEMDIAIANMDAEKSKEVAETLDRQRLGNDKIRNDYVGRRATIDKETGITTFRFGDGTVIQRNKKNEIVFDSRYDDVPKAEETVVETNVSDNQEVLQNDAPVGENELIKEFKARIDDDEFFDNWINYRNNDSKYNELNLTYSNLIKESNDAEIKAKAGRSKSKGWDKTSPEWENFSNLNKERHEAERTLIAYEKELELKFMKEHGNKIAMLGNQNAKKDGVKLEQDKAEYKELIDKFNELNKEFTSNGGHSNRRTTKEQDEKRIAARKGIREIESKLKDFRERIREENKGSNSIPPVYNDIVNDWIKRKVKGQAVSGEWLRKRFGGYYSDELNFGDGYSFVPSNTDDINNPHVRINYEEYGSPSYVDVEIGKMNEDQYRPRFMPQNSEKFTEVYKKFDELRTMLNNAEGNSTTEKFFNTILGTTDNAFNEGKENTSNIPALRFTKDGIKDKGGNLEKIRADLKDEGTDKEGIWLHADDYGSSIPSIFYPENDTDYMTDYFEKDRCFVKPNHPYYNHLKVMALKKELYQGKATKWNKMSVEKQKELEKKIKNLEANLKEPTEEELKEYREYRDGVEKNKEVWEEASRKVYAQEQEKAAKEKEEKTMNTLRDLIGKLQQAMEKEPPVNLEGMSKDEKITTLENRIAKLGLEINNLSDAEIVEGKKQFRDKLQAKLEEVRNEPEETEAEKTQNRSEAMMGNDNAKGKHNVKPQTESEMKSEQKKEKENRKKAGLRNPGNNVGDRVSAIDDIADSWDPNSENYRFKDTGYIAGSQREKVQNTLKRKAEMGETVNVEDVDWNALEENSRTAAQLITKDNVIGKVDYQKMKDSGMDSMAAAMITSIYRSIGKEPVDNTPEGRKNFVWAISTLRERLESCKTYKEVFAMIKEIGEEKSGRYTTLLSMDSEYGDLETQYNNIIAAQKDINHKIINKYYDTKQRFKNEEERTKYWKDFIKKEYPGLEGYKISYGHYRSPYSNMPYISIDEAKKDELLEKKKAARKGAIERIELANPMVKAWKQLGDKCLDSYGQPAKSIYDYYNAFSNLEMWKGSTTFTSQKDRNYAKYLNWGWEEKDRTKKEQSNIVKGRVKQKFEMVVPDKYERIGGRNVSVASSQDLKKAFNFRDIQVGTWVQTDVASAKWHTDNINEGFADLCDITGIPDNLVSMNGRIAIAIGARGVKGAKAHYEPGERVIQINKMKGGGSLGHEWFHAFDNLISEAMNGGDYNEWLTWQGKDQIKMASSHGNNKSSFKQVVANNNDALNQKVREKFTNLVKAMMDGDTPETNTVEFDEEKWDKCQNFYNLKAKVAKYKPRSLNAAQTFEEAKTIIDGYYDDRIRREKDYQSRGYTSGMSVEKLIEEKIKSLEFAAIKFADKEKGEAEYLTGRIVSRYYQDAKKLGNGYWDTPHEMAARAFQCWLNDKLKEQGRKNTYLVGMVDNDVYKGAFYPYPTERDRVKINKAFDELFEVIRSENAIRKAIDILDNFIEKSAEPRFIIKGGRFLIRK